MHVEPDNPQSALKRPDLDSAAIAMQRPLVGFQPNDRFLRLTEAARQALIRGKNFLDERTINDILTGKFENPILGLLAAHLLLLDRKPKFDLIATVVRNTGEMLGHDFPDIVALGLRLKNENKLPNDLNFWAHTVSAPPLMQQSWDILVEASKTDPEILRSGSLASRIGSAALDGGIWLRWKPRRQNRLVDDKTDFKTFDGVLMDVDIQKYIQMAVVPEGHHGAKPMAKIQEDPLRGAAELLLKQASERVRAAALKPDVAKNAIRELVLVLARVLPVESVIRRIEQQGAAETELITSLSTAQRALIPALVTLSNQWGSQKKLSLELIERIVFSIRMPLSVLTMEIVDLVEKLVKWWPQAPEAMYGPAIKFEVDERRLQSAGDDDELKA